MDRKVEDMVTEDAVPAEALIEGEGEVRYEAPGIELKAFRVRVKIVRGGDNGVFLSDPHRRIKKAHCMCSHTPRMPQRQKNEMNGPLVHGVPEKGWGSVRAGPARSFRVCVFFNRHSGLNSPPLAA
jgi:hypothetical protein